MKKNQVPEFQLAPSATTRWPPEKACRLAALADGAALATATARRCRPRQRTGVNGDTGPNNYGWALPAAIDRPSARRSGRRLLKLVEAELAALTCLPRLASEGRITRFAWRARRASPARCHGAIPATTSACCARPSKIATTTASRGNRRGRRNDDGDGNEPVFVDADMICCAGLAAGARAARARALRLPPKQRELKSGMELDDDYGA